MDLQSKLFKAAIYVRLSKEDGDVTDAVKAESNSISNQRELIKDFLKDKKDIEVVSERVDDGFSGVNFERPAFQAMLEDIRKGLVDCVVVKDLSRFGRNYIDSGRYIEQIFPMLGVRFIAVNDNYDSLNHSSQTDGILLPFKNLVNDAYCRDISIKIRSHLEIKRKNGEFIGAFTVYGYKKDPMQKNHMVIDEYAAGIVQNIYRWKLGGMSQQTIADRLNAQGVLSPAEYKKSCGSRYRATFQTSRKALWSPVSIDRILKNEVYTGCLIQGKVTTPNYKVKKTVVKDESQWVRIPDAHEPVVSREMYELVQGLLECDMRISPGAESVYLFSGLLYCADCKNPMTRKISRCNGKEYVYYLCSEHKRKGCCNSSHRISEKDLQEAVLQAIRIYLDKLQDMDKRLKQIAELPEKQRDIRITDDRISMLEKDLEKYDVLKTNLYEDLKSGVLEKDEYLLMKQEFDSRRDKVLEDIRHSKEERDRLAQNIGKHHEWIESLLKHKEIRSLDRTALVEMIERIEVCEGKCINVRFRYEENMAYFNLDCGSDENGREVAV
mgnify:FL=1